MDFKNIDEKTELKKSFGFSDTDIAITILEIKKHMSSAINYIELNKPNEFIKEVSLATNAFIKSLHKNSRNFAFMPHYLHISTNLLSIIDDDFDLESNLATAITNNKPHHGSITNFFNISEHITKQAFELTRFLENLHDEDYCNLARYYVASPFFGWFEDRILSEKNKHTPINSLLINDIISENILNVRSAISEDERRNIKTILNEIKNHLENNNKILSLFNKKVSIAKISVIMLLQKKLECSQNTKSFYNDLKEALNDKNVTQHRIWILNFFNRPTNTLIKLNMIKEMVFNPINISDALVKQGA